MKSIESLLANGAPVIDVRSENEFAHGHAADSVNIPLHELMHRLDEIKQLGTPLVLCCRTGNRSGTACSYLNDMGIECYNAGSWQDVQSASKNHIE